MQKGELHIALENLLDGEVRSDEETLIKYSRDTSIFDVRPAVVVFPQHTEDISRLIQYVSEHKEACPELSLTARSAGSDMSGGPLNESIIVECTQHLNKIHSVDVGGLEAVVEPGVFYRDFEKETLPKGVLLPSYPASKNLAALGGMLANNAAGERTLRYGKTNKYVQELQVVLADGKEYTIKKLSKEELEAKKLQTDFEGKIYRSIYDLIESNYDAIQAARPKVSKNSAGYALWDVWNRETFDLTQLFVGSQGTLGLITRATLRLVKDQPHTKLVTLFFDSWDTVPEVVKRVLPLQPEELEVFDDATLRLGLRFLPKIAKRTKTNLLKFAWQFIPEVGIGIKMLGLPKLVVLAQFAEESEEVIEKKVTQMKELLRGVKGIHMRVLPTAKEAEKYWIMRRESFNLLRTQVKGKHTAPFIDDVIVRPEFLPKFLPQLLAILKKHGVSATLAGHAGSGNFHIIPLMDLSLESERAKIPLVSDEVYDLVIKYEGSITGEHNDGIIRTPYIQKMFGQEVYDIFKKTKDIFDPHNIFNPGKKVGGSIEYMKDHIYRGI